VSFFIARLPPASAPAICPLSRSRSRHRQDHSLDSVQIACSDPRVPAKKKAFHHGDLRRALLEASLAVLEKEGVAALSLRRVAEAAGVTHSAPYHHFPEKTALLAAIAEDGFRLLHEAMRDAVAVAPDDPVERLRAAGLGYVRFAVSHRGHFAVMFRPELADPAQHPAVDAAGGPSYALLRELCEACIAAGHAPGVDPEALVLLAWSSVHGAADLWINGPLARRAERAGCGDAAMLACVPDALSLLSRASAGPRLAAKRPAKRARRAGSR
jgi:AcrR family transcriptional regulator